MAQKKPPTDLGSGYEVTAPPGPPGGGQHKSLNANGPIPALLGRRVRQSLSGPVTGRAAGNSTATTDARGAPRPGSGRPARGEDGSSSFGGLRNPMAQRPSPWSDGTGGPGGAYGGGWADGRLTVRDRHVITQQGTVRNPRGGGSTLPSPEKDGPPQRQYRMIDTTESWQLGTDHEAHLDNTAEHNSVDVTGHPWRRFPLGTQDGTKTLVMGPPLDTYREYGARGPRGMHGPEPDIWDPNWTLPGAAGAGGRGRLVQQGAPGTQPADRRLIYGGLPHGLHSPTLDSATLTMSRQANIPQMTPPRQDRPASSRIAGQSYSQTIVPESQAGRATQQTPRMAPGAAGRRPGVMDRFVSRT